MPVFRTRPSANLSNSIRRLIASGGSGITPMQEAQADMMASQTARNLTLADKARAEVEAMQRSEAARNDPAVATEYAGNAAGLDRPTSTRLSNHLRGVLEQPGPSDIDDAAAVGRDAQPYVTGAPNLEPGQQRVFQSALASTIANRLATGKTNAAQLAQAGDRINETALTNQAANTEDVPAANRIIAAVAGKVREPFKVGGQGQVLNEETGAVNEGTLLAQAAARLSGARTATEGARQGELGTRSRFNTARVGTEGSRQTELDSRAGRNVALADLADARAGAVARGETNRGGARTSPQQVERWVSEVARKEWSALDPRERKGMNYAQHLEKVRERFKPTAAGAGATDEVDEAHGAIAKGADPVKVAKRFKERMGFDMPTIDTQDAVDMLDEED